MGTLSQRVSTAIAYACAIFALAAIAVGVVGVLGVRSATDIGQRISSDELATASATATFGQRADEVYSTGLALGLTTDPGRHAALSRELYNRAVPGADAGLASLVRLHADDGAAERADIATLRRQWQAVRAGVAPGAGSTPDELTSLVAPLRDHIDALIAREDTDGRADQQRASDSGTRTITGIAIAVALAVMVCLALAWVGIRRLRRAVEPAEDQVEFSDTLQLAEGEDEAHNLLARHLERTVPDGSVVVLNRNNSADRLEAVTQVPPESPLVRTLAQADPRSCLAVRSGRVHDEHGARAALLACSVCSTCPGHSTCTPLTVGGEVIGSVLVNRGSAFSVESRQRIRDSVAQAAPVLANLRNLAIAELRAATDSLTGLPNKRAVIDTSKRLLAHASRTMTPFSLVLLDLDHFKDINDRYGHPVGDQALANVGDALHASVRDSDFCGRVGGEEFAVMLPDTDVNGAIIAAEKIRSAIANITLPGADVRLTASVGIASYPDHAATTERLERLADAALYVAKRSGRDRIEVATPPPDHVPLFPAPVAAGVRPLNGH